MWREPRGIDRSIALIRTQSVEERRSSHFASYFAHTLEFITHLHTGHVCRPFAYIHSFSFSPSPRPRCRCGRPRPRHLALCIHPRLSSPCYRLLRLLEHYLISPHLISLSFSLLSFFLASLFLFLFSLFFLSSFPLSSMWHTSHIPIGSHKVQYNTVYSHGT
jgi:hypothetical protein